MRKPAGRTLIICVCFSGDAPIYSAATKGFRRLNIAIRNKACGARQRGREMRKESVRENLKGEGETGAQRRLPLFLRVVPHISRPAPSEIHHRTKRSSEYARRCTFFIFCVMIFSEKCDAGKNFVVSIFREANLTVRNTIDKEVELCR